MTSITADTGSFVTSGPGVIQYHRAFLKLLDSIQATLSSKGIKVEDEFVTLMVKLVALNPSQKFLIKQQMIQSELERMRKLVLDQITLMSPLSRDIISLQLFYKTSTFPTREDTVYAFREEADLRVAPLIDKIKLSVPDEDDDKRQRFWYAALVQGMMGMQTLKSPQDEGSLDVKGQQEHLETLKETEDVLDSVLPKSEFFMTLKDLTSTERELEITSVIRTAIGLRLLEKHKRGQGYGKKIENIPKILPEMIKEGLSKMDKMRKDNTQRLIRYTLITQPYFMRGESYRMGRRALDKDRVGIREGLVMVHQILIYLKELTEHLLNEQGIISTLISDYHDMISELRQIVVKDKAESDEDLRKEKLYPKLIELSDLWRDLQESEVFVDSITQVVNKIEEIAVQEEGGLSEVDKLTEKFPLKRVPTEKEFFKFPEVQVPEDKYSQAKRIEFREDFDPLNMGLRGFCIYSLVKGVGLPVLSNPNVGVFNWKGQHYLISSVRGAVEFRRDPETFVKKVYAIARRWPELILLLNLEDEVMNPASISDADRSGKTANVMISAEVEIQTDLHPMESNVVPHYTWNEWELRRRGLVMSKILNCRTHSTQTHWQALKVNTEAQTYLKKSTFIQTNRDQSTQLSLNHQYIVGFRGYSCGLPPHNVDITTDNPCDLKCMISSSGSGSGGSGSSNDQNKKKSSAKEERKKSSSVKKDSLDFEDEVGEHCQTRSQFDAINF